MSGPPRISAVARWIEDLDPPCRAIVKALRSTIRRAAVGTEETVVWGSLSYHRPAVGGRVKGAVCQVVVKAGNVRLDFIHGVLLPDPHGLLRGDGISKRHVAIPSVAAARRREVRALIREAAATLPGV